MKGWGTAAQQALAVKIARSFARSVPPNVQRADIEQAALIGLWDGLRKKGPDADVTYLRWRIRGSIRDELRRQDWLPRRRTLAKGQRRERPSKTVLHFEDVGPDAEERVPAPGASPEDLLIDRHLLDEVHATPLQPRLRRVLDMFLAGYRLLDVAAELGVSQPRASQLYWRAVAVIRASLRAKESYASRFRSEEPSEPSEEARRR